MARQEGIQEAGRRILTATGWRGKNAEKATPEDIGKAFRIVIGEQRKRADEAVAAQKQAEKAQKAALTDFQAKEEELRGQAWNWWQRAQNAENTVKERVESVIEGERAQMERKINRAERAELAALARAELFFEKLEEYWEWNVVDRTERAMQLPRQEAEEDKKNEQEQQQQYSRGRGWGR